MDGANMERQSSIEDEPRTLDYNQIEFAREAALYVVNTRSMQEAFRIFTEGVNYSFFKDLGSSSTTANGQSEDRRTELPKYGLVKHEQGLEPVERCAEGGGCKSLKDGGDDEQDQKCWNKRVSSGLRDIVSAPF
ncbi:hypothetical protein PHJA_001848800 [Phtheirospermum japonicum]|uniref:Uncharacterized protein n=1 Tax=Phtheirospermum japonicum TaxID=374723 RepID=A0A830C8I8_9LAMI|nr:hypothetical protein PHJA_001848800 [Phtheirospermum japonicum]